MVQTTTYSQYGSILRARHYLLEEQETDGSVQNDRSLNNLSKTAWYNAYLLMNFGIEVDKPEKLTENHVKQIATDIHEVVPASFYTNPQDTKYFTQEELAVEQIVSYFAYGSNLGRIEVFKKNLPQYIKGSELVLRTFYIISEAEARGILRDIVENYCAYTRPFSVDEQREFLSLYSDFYDNSLEIKCKDNIFKLLDKDLTLARFLDKKALVKYSIQNLGERSFNGYTKDIKVTKVLDTIAKCLPLVKDCPLSKKQAKYYNKLLKLCNSALPRATNIKSPDKWAMEALRNNNVLQAASIYAANGSMLERRLKMLLSRATLAEGIEIINMISNKNPIVLYQLLSALTTEDRGPRVFTFNVPTTYGGTKIVKHTETDYETTWRKSRLDPGLVSYLSEFIINKIKSYYKELPAFGKVYVADNFYKIALPTNTSAGDKGLDVLPTGSRVPCRFSKVRTFVYWNNAFDIDSSLVIVDKSDNINCVGWFGGRTLYADGIQWSGDITGFNGAEYFDIDLDNLKARGVKYVIQTFHGFNSSLNCGEIWAGYQVKDNLKTTAWDPKNIEMQFKVFGESRGCIAFAIDVQAQEVIILNQIVADDSRVVRPSGFDVIKKYLKPEFLNINIGIIAESRGLLTANPAEADVIFDDTFVPDDEIEANPKVIRSWELEKLVALVNE